MSFARSSVEETEYPGATCGASLNVWLPAIHHSTAQHHTDML
jgi:hypothetical protein